MKRKILFLLLVTCLCAVFCLSVSAVSGSGTESDPYIVTTVDEFLAINNNKSACYKLDADLVLPTSTGAYITSSGGAFTGVFDGNGHKPGEYVKVKVLKCTSATLIGELV